MASISLYSCDKICQTVMMYIFIILDLQEGEFSLFEKNNMVDYEDKGKKNVVTFCYPCNGIYQVDDIRVEIEDFIVDEKRISINNGRKDFSIVKKVTIYGKTIEDVKVFIAKSNEFISEKLLKENMKLFNKVIIKNFQDWVWVNQSSIPKREESTIFLKKGQLDCIKEKISEFVSEETRNEYLAHGIPYKLNILLHGNPGVGKTTLIHCLASIYDAMICTLNINSDIQENAFINSFKYLNEFGGITFLVIEDIDCILEDRKKNDSMKNNITMQGLLNCMDGFNNQEGVILIITTNHPNKLEEALIRPGRIDMAIELTQLDKYQARNMFISFMKNDLHFEEVWENIKTKQVLPCAFQEFLFKNRKCENILDKIQDLLEIISTGSNKNNMYL